METYALVVTGSAVHIIFILSKLNKMHTKSIDFTLAYSQASMKTNIFLYNLQGIFLNDNGNNSLKLQKNFYSLKDTGCTWWQYMSKNLEASKLVIYIHDCLILAPRKSDFNNVYKDIQEKFDI